MDIDALEQKIVDCKYRKRCPVIKKGGIRCLSTTDCKTYLYIETGKIKID